MSDQTNAWTDECPARGAALHHVKSSFCDPRSPEHEGHRPESCCECGFNPWQLRRSQGTATNMPTYSADGPEEPRLRTRLDRDAWPASLSVDELMMLEFYVIAVERDRGYR